MNWEYRGNDDEHYTIGYQDGISFSTICECVNKDDAVAVVKALVLMDGARRLMQKRHDVAPISWRKEIRDGNVYLYDAAGIEIATVKEWNVEFVNSSDIYYCIDAAILLGSIEPEGENK